MKYEFKRSVHIAGKDFPKGVSEVSEVQESHAHFLRYVKAGYIVDHKVIEPVKIEHNAVRAKIILDRLAEKQMTKIEDAPDEVQLPLDMEPVAEASEVVPVEPPKEEKKKGGRPKKQG